MTKCRFGVCCASFWNRLTIRCTRPKPPRKGLTDAATRRPDVVLLDLGLPDFDGVNVLRRLREWSQVPVIVLSVRDDEEGKVAALDAGADDYVTKPFSSAELLARLRAAQRKTRPAGRGNQSRFKSGDLIVDLAARLVKRAATK